METVLSGWIDHMSRLRRPSKVDAQAVVRLGLAHMLEWLKGCLRVVHPGQVPDGGTPIETGTLQVRRLNFWISSAGFVIAAYIGCEQVRISEEQNRLSTAQAQLGREQTEISRRQTALNERQTELSERQNVTGAANAVVAIATLGTFTDGQRALVAQSLIDEAQGAELKGTWKLLARLSSVSVEATSATAQQVTANEVCRSPQPLGDVLRQLSRLPPEGIAADLDCRTLLRGALSGSEPIAELANSIVSRFWKPDWAKYEACRSTGSSTAKILLKAVDPKTSPTYRALDYALRNSQGHLERVGADDPQLRSSETRYREIRIHYEPDAACKEAALDLKAQVLALPIGPISPNIIVEPVNKGTTRQIIVYIGKNW